jgi:signal transduction histidine kinase
MAHDLRSPLTAILTLADALRRGQSGPITDAQKRQLGVIYSAALGLSSTTSNMTELLQRDDFLAEDSGPLSIREILGSVRDILQPVAEERGVEIRLTTTTTDQRQGYGLALGRVLLNLTTNGLKFTENGYVEIGARSTGDLTVEFSVQDTGPGIDPLEIDALFDPFHRRSDGQGLCFSGAGLGLTISRRLVEAMGSELYLETDRCRGSRFFFEVELPFVAT